MSAQFKRIEKIYQRYYSAHSHKKVVCVAHNYVKLNASLGQPLPEKPNWFDKPMSSVLLSGETLHLPAHFDNLNHEVELGVRIGMTGKNISPNDYLKHISHYFLAIDSANRTLAAMYRKNGSPWCLFKGSDGFFAMSDLVERDDVEDPHKLGLEL